MIKYNNSTYRVTPKKNKNQKTYVIQRKSDRSTVQVDGSPFSNPTKANDAMIRLLSENNRITDPTGPTFNEAYKEFAQWCVDQKKAGSRVTLHSMKRYMTTYDLRISKYIDKDLLLKDFGLKQMEAFLDKMKANNVPFKTMKNAVKDIKKFLKRANAEGKNPNMSMTTFKINDYLSVLPEDDDLYFTKSVTEDQINLFTDEKVHEILSALKQKRKAGDMNAALLTAIFVCFFFFGLRKSELMGLQSKNVDFENRVLRVEGAFVENRLKNKTKASASRRSIEIDDIAVQFLKEWQYFRLAYKPNNPYLIPGRTINGVPGPISDIFIRDNMWKLFAQHDLAKINYKQGGHVNVISSPLKGCLTKVFRHRLGSHLLSYMNNPTFDPNKVKRQLGHQKFSTSSDIYGNKIVRGTEDERRAFAEAKAKANRHDIIAKALQN